MRCRRTFEYVIVPWLRPSLTADLDATKTQMRRKLCLTIPLNVGPRAANTYAPHNIRRVVFAFSLASELWNRIGTSAGRVFVLVEDQRSNRVKPDATLAHRGSKRYRCESSY
jgi:hypothetical protein